MHWPTPLILRDQGLSRRIQHNGRGDDGGQERSVATSQRSAQQLPGEGTGVLIVAQQNLSITTVASSPRAFCLRRRAPAGKSYSKLGSSGVIRAGSNTITSAAYPSRSNPRPCRPQYDAGTNVSIRMACSSVNSSSSRTQ